MEGLVWPTGFDSEKVLRMANPCRIRLLEDLRITIEEEEIN